MKYKYNNSSIEIDQGVYHMRLREKNPYLTGYAYGKLMIKAGYPLIELMKPKISQLPFKIIGNLMKKYFKKLIIPKRYLEEIRGYADSTGISYDFLYYTNFSFDVIKKYGIHCSTFTFFNKNSTLMARNTDGIPFLISKFGLEFLPPLIIDVKMPKTNRFVHVSLPFFVGAIEGFNFKGIGITSHETIRVMERKRSKNLATPLIVRMLLEKSENMKNANILIKRNIPRRSINLMVTSSKEKETRIYELNPSETNTIETKNNFLCCTTHFRGEKMKEYHKGSVKESMDRLESMQELVETHKSLSIKNAIKILQDTSNGIEYNNTGSSMASDGTFQSFVMDLTNRKIYISDGKENPVPLTGKYREIKI
jgi:isopenicillin-N N-acyltransferase like protein